MVLECLFEMLPADVHIKLKKGHQVLYDNKDFTWDADEDGHYRMRWTGFNPLSLWQEVDYCAHRVEVLVRWPNPIYDDAVHCAQRGCGDVLRLRSGRPVRGVLSWRTTPSWCSG